VFFFFYYFVFGVIFFFFFFFQAEDGIRDRTVTGVQTCALPIYGGRTWRTEESGTESDLFDVKFFDEREGWAVGGEGVAIHTADRSEERRVGKECRSRWSA